MPRLLPGQIEVGYGELALFRAQLAGGFTRTRLRGSRPRRRAARKASSQLRLVGLAKALISTAGGAMGAFGSPAGSGAWQRHGPIAGQTGKSEHSTIPSRWDTGTSGLGEACSVAATVS